MTAKRDTLKTLTTYTVARLVNCSPRTVSGWCDSGELRHFRLPSAKKKQRTQRRIVASDLIGFLRANDMPIPPELASSVLAYGSPVPHGCRVAVCPVSFGIALASDPPSAAILTDCDGLSSLTAMVRAVRAMSPHLPLAVIVGADVSFMLPDPFTRVFSRPVDMPALSNFVGLPTQEKLA